MKRGQVAVFIVVLLVVVLFLVVFYFSGVSITGNVISEDEDGVMMEKDNDVMMEEGDSMEKKGDVMGRELSVTQTGRTVTIDEFRNGCSITAPFECVDWDVNIDEDIVSVEIMNTGDDVLSINKFTLSYCGTTDADVVLRQGEAHTYRYRCLVRENNILESDILLFYNKIGSNAELHSTGLLRSAI
jgi:hypothetical protein